MQQGSQPNPSTIDGKIAVSFTHQIAHDDLLHPSTISELASNLSNDYSANVVDINYIIKSGKIKYIDRKKEDYEDELLEHDGIHFSLEWEEQQFLQDGKEIIEKEKEYKKNLKY